jgi:hypothetical protein
MKIKLLICFVLITSQLVNAQQPKGPGGNDLFKKGNCERAGVDFSVCTYCEDKELTKNCKDYWCTDNGTCTEAPLKKPNNQLVRTNVDGIKYTALGKNDTTSKLPKGTKFVNGKVTVRNGYKAVYSSDKKMVAIKSANGPGVTGTFKCSCSSLDGSCSVSVVGGIIMCEGDECCRIVVTIGDSYGLTMEKIEQSPEKLKWKKLVLPVKSN